MLIDRAPLTDEMYEGFKAAHATLMAQFVPTLASNPNDMPAGIAIFGRVPTGELTHHLMPSSVVGQMMANDTSKHMMLGLIYDMLNPSAAGRQWAMDKLGFLPKFIIQYSEAWMTKDVPGQERVRPVDSPDRKEALIMMLHCSLGTWQAVHDIVRNEKAGKAPMRWFQSDEFPSMEEMDMLPLGRLSLNKNAPRTTH